MQSFIGLRSIHGQARDVLIRLSNATRAKSQFRYGFRGNKVGHRSFATSAIQLHAERVAQSEIAKWMSIVAVSGGLVWMWRNWGSENSSEILAEENVSSEALEAEEGYKRVVEAAKSGNAEAQYDYAVMLYRGEGVKQDFTAAIHWFEKAAEGGVPEAMYNLGVLYASGYRVAKQVSTGLKWLERAKEAGSPEAALRLAKMYHRGEEVPVSASRAFTLYEQAALANVAEAQFQCGVLKGLGNGTVKDDGASFSYFLQAAEQGHLLASCNVGMMYHNGLGVTRDLNKAFYWYREAAQGQESDAMAFLAIFHLYGLYDPTTSINIPQNLPLALELLQKAAPTSYTAQRILGGLYLARGEYPMQAEISLLLPPNPSLAYQMFANCARHDDNDCRSELASMIINGEGVDPKHADLSLAFKLIAKAASEDHVNALLKKGILQYNGIGTAQNATLSVASLKKAAKLSHPAAHFLLGLALIDGEGTDKSYTYGISHLRSASGLGFAQADECIRELARDNPLPLDLDALRRSLLFQPEAPVKL